MLKKFVAFGNYYEELTNFNSDTLKVIPLKNFFSSFSNYIKPHIHQNIYQIFIIEEGEGDFILNNIKISSKNRMVLLIPCNVVHGFIIKDNIKGVSISININYLNTFFGYNPEIFDFFNTPTFFENIPESSFVKINHLAENLFNELNNKKLFSDKIIKNLLELLLLNICRDLNKSNSKVKINHLKMVKLFNDFKVMINEYKDKRNDLGYFTKKLKITLNKLNTVCKQVTGKSASKIINEQIIFDAQLLLLYSNLSIAEISKALNFYISKLFY